MLRETTLAFLPKEGVIITDSQREHPVAREQMIAEYVAIQHEYADVKDALYRMARAQMDARKWGGALITLHALSKIDSDYRDIKALQYSSRVDYLRNLLPADAYAANDRIRHLGDWAIRGLEELAREEPQVSNAGNFGVALGYARSCADGNEMARESLRAYQTGLRVELGAIVTQGHS